MTGAPRSAKNAPMQVHLKILRLQQSLKYAAATLPLRFGDAALEEYTRRGGESLLEFDDGTLISTAEDGPHIQGIPQADVAYCATTQAGRGNGFELEAGAYLFFQWRAQGAAAQGCEARPLWTNMLEEVAREIWWQGIVVEGPWFLRLIPEDNRIAFQILRRIRS